MKDLERRIKDAIEKNKQVELTRDGNLVLNEGVPGEVVRHKPGKSGYIPPANSTLIFLGEKKEKISYHGYGLTLSSKYYYLKNGENKGIYLEFKGDFASVVDGGDIPEHIYQNLVVGSLMGIFK